MLRRLYCSFDSPSARMLRSVPLKICQQKSDTREGIPDKTHSPFSVAGFKVTLTIPLADSSTLNTPCGLISVFTYYPTSATSTGRGCSGAYPRIDRNNCETFVGQFRRICPHKKIESHLYSHCTHELHTFSSVHHLIANPRERSRRRQ